MCIAVWALACVYKHLPNSETQACAHGYKKYWGEIMFNRIFTTRRSKPMQTDYKVLSLRQLNYRVKYMKNTFRIIAAQINTLVGDIAGNTEKIISYALKSRDELKGDLVVFPEMALTGYPPEDLLMRAELYQQIKVALTKIRRTVKNIYVLIGYPEQSKEGRHNNAILIYNGKTAATYSKQELPNYGVFDEKRYFIAGTKPCVVKIKKNKIALAICEDLWMPKVMQQAKKLHADLMVCINASPFDMDKPYVREKIMGKRAREGKMPIVYVNSIGGQDELVFDGGSMILDAKGNVVQRAEFFKEVLMPTDFTLPKISPQPQNVLPITTIEERVYQALVLGVRDYVEKNNFKGAIIGASGGIDSALTLAIAVDALGKNRVETLFMPSRYTEKVSAEITRAQAELLQVKYSVIPIDQIFDCYLKNLSNEFKDLPHDITEENLQARCRGTLLMAYSNKKKLIVLSTGNKSEMAMGYATLYGDMVGGFCVLKDVPKTLVYRLANYRNRLTQVIPQMAIDRAPSAELKPNQKDTDSLPPYPILDEILERYIERNQSTQEIITAGFDEKIVQKIISAVNHNEYKRRQAPIGVRITTRAFGRDRRYPITKKQ